MIYLFGQEHIKKIKIMSNEKIGSTIFTITTIFYSSHFDNCNNKNLLKILN